MIFSVKEYHTCMSGEVGLVRADSIEEAEEKVRQSERWGNAFVEEIEWEGDTCILAWW